MDLKQKIFNLVDQFAVDKFSQKEFIPGVTPVPVSGKVLDAEELKYMVEASLDGWLTTGRFNKVELRTFDESIDMKSRDFESIYAIAIK